VAAQQNESHAVRAYKCCICEYRSIIFETLLSKSIILFSVVTSIVEDHGMEKVMKLPLLSLFLSFLLFLCVFSSCQIARMQKVDEMASVKVRYPVDSAEPIALQDQPPETVSAQKEIPEEKEEILAEDVRDYSTQEPLAMDAPVKAIIDKMSIEQRIGQRFISKIEGTGLTDQIISLIREENIGGVILYPWNVSDALQVKTLIEGIQNVAAFNSPSIGLFISVDQEGGRVNALKLRETSSLTPPFFWGLKQDPDYVRAAAYIISSEIRGLGCNMNFAPVLDLYGTADKTIIGDRSMGTDPLTIGNLGLAYVEGAKKAGIIPVVKHFPGHGSSTVDSHHSLPVIEIDETTLRNRDLKPFVTAISGGVEAMMTAHVLYSQIDPEYPVTLSSRILREILRGELGFEGVVISDGMSMGALSNHFEIADTLRLMFKAGVDLILVHHKYDLRDLKKIVRELYQTGEITEGEINEGVERILRLKLNYGLIDMSRQNL
jgi:beta-N-acetylhexosaminidase